MSKPSQPSGKAAKQRDKGMSQSDPGKASPLQTDKETRHGHARRRVLQSIAAGGATITVKALPEQWAKPVLDVAMLPAHAQGTCEAQSLTCTLNDVTPGSTVGSGDGGYDNVNTLNVAPALPLSGNGTVMVDLWSDTGSDSLCGTAAEIGYVSSASFDFSAIVTPPCPAVTLQAGIAGPDSLWSLGSPGSQTGVVDPDNGAVAFNNVVVNFTPPGTINDPSSEDYSATLDVRILVPGVNPCVIDIEFSESVFCNE